MSADDISPAKKLLLMTADEQMKYQNKFWQQPNLKNGEKLRQEKMQKLVTILSLLVARQGTQDGERFC